jgi:hypothetical protein
MPTPIDLGHQADELVEVVNVQTQATRVNRRPAGQADEQLTAAEMGSIRPA